ncbi:MAG: hypothetical protein L6416_09530 [Candidatus Omnitrophica bacterium]|nr:hypothetical protein [Candidatus Omnitrophota bacterium]
MEEELEGYFLDDGTWVNPALVPKPSLCVMCKYDEDKKEEVLCMLTRTDQQDEDDFKCCSYKMKVF